MSSKKGTEAHSIPRLKIPPHLPHKLSSKFLPRTLEVSPDTTKTFSIILVKRFYVKKLVCVYEEEELPSVDSVLIPKLFKNNKTHKTLCNAETSSLLKPHLYKCLKNSKIEEHSKI